MLALVLAVLAYCSMALGALGPRASGTPHLWYSCPELVHHAKLNASSVHHGKIECKYPGNIHCYYSESNGVEEAHSAKWCPHTAPSSSYVCPKSDKKGKVHLVAEGGAPWTLYCSYTHWVSCVYHKGKLESKHSSKSCEPDAKHYSPHRRRSPASDAGTVGRRARSGAVQARHVRRASTEDT